MLDKIKGGLFGVAIGDAIGAVTEFLSKQEIQNKYGWVTEMMGGGYWDLEEGETTDDTAMTIALAKGIITNSNNPIEEIGKQFLSWYKSRPKDIGITIRSVFDRYGGDWFEAAKKVHESLDGRSGGNGSLMRTLPVSLAYSNPDKIKEISILQSKMTHYDDVAAEACVIYNKIASRVLEGEELKTAIRVETKNTMYEEKLDSYPDCNPNGYVVNTMKWVLYWLMNSNTFEDVVLGATNMGDDSDTIAAIAGGLKGLEIGFNEIPRKYVNKLLDKEILTQLSNILYEIRDQDTSELKEHGWDYVKELERDTTDLIRLSEKLGTYEVKTRALEQIKRNIYLFRITLTEENTDFDRKLLVWRQVENRYNRSVRLITLGAPLVVIVHELKWLLTMIEHMNLVFQGVEPHFAKEQLEELESIAEIERGFEEQA